MSLGAPSWVIHTLAARRHSVRPAATPRRALVPWFRRRPAPGASIVHRTWKGAADGTNDGTRDGRNRSSQQRPARAIDMSGSLLPDAARSVSECRPPPRRRRVTRLRWCAVSATVAADVGTPPLDPLRGLHAARTGGFVSARAGLLASLQGRQQQFVTFGSSRSAASNSIRAVSSLSNRRRGLLCAQGCNVMLRKPCTVIGRSLHALPWVTTPPSSLRI